jgi:hypothetical protein
MAEQVAGTIREAARRYGLGEKLLRRQIRAGAIPVYTADCRRPRVLFREVEAWLRSTVAPVTRHAEGRVAELLRREGRGR